MDVLELLGSCMRTWQCLNTKCWTWCKSGRHFTPILRPEPHKLSHVRFATFNSPPFLRVTFFRYFYCAPIFHEPQGSRRVAFNHVHRFREQIIEQETRARLNVKLFDPRKGLAIGSSNVHLLFVKTSDYRCSRGALLITVQRLEDRLNECPWVKRSVFISNLKNVLSLSAAVKNSLNPLSASALLSADPRSARILLYVGDQMEADSLPGINYARPSRIIRPVSPPLAASLELTFRLFSSLVILDKRFNLGH